jgi:hypothetical protein
MLPLLLPTIVAPALAHGGGCNLSGLWSWSPIQATPHGSGSGWSNWPPTYNFSHDITSGTVSFRGYTTPASVDQTWRPSDTFSHATGKLHPPSSVGEALRLVLVRAAMMMTAPMIL